MPNLKVQPLHEVRVDSSAGDPHPKRRLVQVVPDLVIWDLKEILKQAVAHAFREEFGVDLKERNVYVGIDHSTDFMTGPTLGLELSSIPTPKNADIAIRKSLAHRIINYLLECQGFRQQLPKSIVSEFTIGIRYALRETVGWVFDLDGEMINEWPS